MCAMRLKSTCSIVPIARWMFALAPRLLAKRKFSCLRLALELPQRTRFRCQRERDKQWFAWLRPAFAVPVLASLLAVVGYQNLVTLPALHNSANQPRIVQVAPLVATRGGSHVSITADRVNGIALPIDLPLDSAAGYTSISFELSNAQEKPVWSNSVPAAAQNSGGDLQLSVVVPGAMLGNGTYTLAVSGVSAHGERTALEHYVFDVVIK